MENTLSNQIKNLRVEFRMTQTEFAKIIGVNLHTITLWECRNGKPSLRNIKKIEEKFNIKLDF